MHFWLKMISEYWRLIVCWECLRVRTFWRARTEHMNILSQWQSAISMLASLCKGAKHDLDLLQWSLLLSSVIGIHSNILRLDLAWYLHAQLWHLLINWHEHSRSNTLQMVSTMLNMAWTAPMIVWTMFTSKQRGFKPVTYSLSDLRFAKTTVKFRLHQQKQLQSFLCTCIQKIVSKFKRKLCRLSVTLGMKQKCLDTYSNNDAEITVLHITCQNIHAVYYILSTILLAWGLVGTSSPNLSIDTACSEYGGCWPVGNLYRLGSNTPTWSIS